MRLLIVSIIFITSCGINKNIEQEDPSEMHIKQSPVEEKMHKDKGSNIYALSCGEYKQSLKQENVSWVYMNDMLLKCLTSTGYHGKDESNKQLAGLIKDMHIDDFGGLFLNTSKFRGPEIFESLLSIANDFNPELINDEGNGEKSMRTKSDAMSSYYTNMIKTIDGLDYKTYRPRIFSNYEFSASRYNSETLEDNFQYYEEKSMRFYNEIVTAWKEGRIILKDYSEE